MKLRRNACFALCAATALAIAAAPRLAHADGQFQANSAYWHMMTLCAQQAAKQYPDHTPKGNTKREASRQDCLRRNHLPVSPQPAANR